MAVWASRGQVVTVSADSGQDSTTLHGTVDLKTAQVTVTESAQMNAAATVAHLEALLARCPDVPILLLWESGTAASGSGHSRVPGGPSAPGELARSNRGTGIGIPQEHVWSAARRRVCYHHIERSLHSLARRFQQYLTGATLK